MQQVDQMSSDEPDIGDNLVELTKNKKNILNLAAKRDLAGRSDPLM